MKASISSRMFLAKRRGMSSAARHLLPVLLSVVGLILSPRPVAGADCVLAPPGLVAWWLAQGDATDLVGPNHGTISGATYTAGKVGQAFSFNGGAGILVSDSAGLRPATQFTIEGWIKTPGILEGSMAGFIVARSGNAFTGYELLVGTASQAGRLRFTINGGIGGADLFSTNSVTDDSIHHVAATYDGTMMRVYLDGVLDGQLAFNEPIVYQPGDPLWIGRREFASIPGYFIGLIDELSIYNRALTASEIAGIYAAGSSGKCLRRINWFKIAGGGGESTNTTHRLRGTVGQHDAGGPLTNNSISLVGGFWQAADEADAGCVPMYSGMVSWWRGEGDATDALGNNSPNQTIGVPQFVNAEVGQGIKLDGNSGFAVADNDSLDFGAAVSFTIESWIRIDGVFANDSLFVDKRQPGGGLGYGLGLLGSNSGADTRRFYVFAQDGVNSVQALTAPVLDGGFHHVAVVLNRANSSVGIYLDGVLQQNNSIGSLANFANSGRFFIGHQSLDVPNTTGVPFNGVLDEMVIYNRALSAAEIQAVYMAGSFGRCDTRPILNIAALPGAVRLTWPTNATGYLLETNSSLALPAGWGVLTSNYGILNTNYAVTNAVGGATRFYRLSKP